MPQDVGLDLICVRSRGREQCLRTHRSHSTGLPLDLDLVAPANLAQCHMGLRGSIMADTRESTKHLDSAREFVRPFGYQILDVLPEGNLTLLENHNKRFIPLEIQPREGPWTSGYHIKMPSE